MVAARLRSEPQAGAEMVHGRYSEFKVIVNGDTIIERRWCGVSRIAPSGAKILTAVRARWVG
jgi:hypothetical protein